MRFCQNLIGCTIILYAMQACTNNHAAPAVAHQPFISDSLMNIIRIDTVKMTSVGGALKFSGEVGFDENHIARVFSNSSGQVVDVRVSFGDRVHKGQVLAVIKSADIAGNYSDRTGAVADVNIAKRQLENARSLYESGISSAREYEEARQNYEKAVAALNKINSLISINGKGHTSANGMYYVTAPSDGFIVEKKINPGSFLRADMTDNIFTISDLRYVWVWANVYESDISKVKEGQQADVTTLAYPNQVFHGRIDKVSDLLDPLNKTLKIRITLSNEQMLLKPEMFANVIVNNPAAKMQLAIPSASIVNDNGKSFVIVYHNRNDVQVKEIHPDKSVGDITYVQDGVSDGDLVISQNQILLYNELAEK